MQIFAKRKPKGSTNLAGVLSDAVHPDTFIGGSGFCCFGTPGVRKPETILVITDGTPDSQGNVEKVIKNATHNMQSDDELSITMVQIGTDKSASSWLQKVIIQNFILFSSIICNLLTYLSSCNINTSSMTT